MKESGIGKSAVLLMALITLGAANVARAADDVPPDTITGINLEIVACNDLKISWDGVSDGGGYRASGLKEYTISRKPSPSTVKLVARTLGTPIPLMDGGRQFTVDTVGWDEPTITITVNATDNEGNTSPATTASIDKPTWCMDPTPPTKPQLTLEPQEACTGPVLTADAVDLGVWPSGIRRIHWRRNGGLLMAGSTIGDNSIRDVYGVLPGETYYYQAAAEDNAGNLSVWSDAHTYTIPDDCSVYADKYGTSVAVFLAYFSDGPAPVLSKTDVVSMVFGNVDDSNRNLAGYIDDISFGKMHLFSAGVFDYIPLPRTGGEYGCERNSFGEWSTCFTQLIQEDILNHHGVDASIAERLIFIIGGYNYASAGGVAVTMGGQKTVEESVPTLAHEFLHTLDMDHSGDKRSAACWGYGSLSPHPHDPEFGCTSTIYRYGDRYSVLGSSAPNLYHPPIYAKQLAGWLEPDETRLLTQDLAYEMLYSNDERTNGLKQILIRRYVNGRPSLYSIEYRMRRNYNGAKGEFSGDVREPEGLYIRQILPFNLQGNDNSPSTLYVGKVPSNSRRFYDPYLRIGIEWMYVGYGFDRSRVFVSTCGISSFCNSSWNDFIPGMDD